MKPDPAEPLPAAIRTIFARWAEACDPGPLGAGDDPRALAAFYRRVAQAAAGMHLARQDMVRIRADAARNREAGQFTELRREGATVLPWIDSLLAARDRAGRKPRGRAPR